ncbi:hypothetical protein A0J51_00953 [Gluconobacter japonicus]|nr:hypothetical protein A0J51_00953 [Gluconobacter japonicus]
MQVREWAQFRMRIPPDLHIALKLNAVRNRRTLNAELVFALEGYAATISETKKASDQPGSNSDASTTTV